MAVHGTPSNPEYIIPAKDLASTVASVPDVKNLATKRAGDIHVSININGQMITTREFTRTQLFPEMEQAIRSGLGGALKSAFGVA